MSRASWVRKDSGGTRDETQLTHNWDSEKTGQTKGGRAFCK